MAVGQVPGHSGHPSASAPAMTLLGVWVDHRTARSSVRRVIVRGCRRLRDARAESLAGLAADLPRPLERALDHDVPGNRASEDIRSRPARTQASSRLLSVTSVTSRGHGVERHGSVPAIHSRSLLLRPLGPPCGIPPIWLSNACFAARRRCPGLRPSCPAAPHRRGHRHPGRHRSDRTPSSATSSASAFA
jgi:hypothetical protein